MLYWYSTSIKFGKSQYWWNSTQRVFFVGRKRNERAGKGGEAVSWMLPTWLGSGGLPVEHVLLWNGWRLLRTPLGSHGEKGKEGWGRPRWKVLIPCERWWLEIAFVLAKGRTKRHWANVIVLARKHLAYSGNGWNLNIGTSVMIVEWDPRMWRHFNFWEGRYNWKNKKRKISNNLCSFHSPPLLFSKQSYFLILLGQGLHQVYYKYQDRKLKRIHFQGKAKEGSQAKSSGRDISNLVFLQNYYQGPLGRWQIRCLINIWPCGHTWWLLSSRKENIFKIF